MSQINARLVYKNALRAMVNAGVNPQQAILSQSYLRLERQLTTAATSYQFGVLVNDQPAGQGAVRPTEQRLNLQDAFYVGNVSFYLTTGAATDTALDLKTYNDRFVFTGAGVATQLLNVWNGYLSLTVNNRVITPSWSLYSHYWVGQTQQNAALASGVNIDQFDGTSSATVACEPNWVLIGSKNNVLTINLPAAPTALTAGTNTYMVIILRGILAQNVTVVS